jgi:hypothetical protein
VGGREKALIILLPMLTLDQLKKDIVNFWEFDVEEQRDAVLEKIRTCAANTDKKTFIGEVRRLFEPAEFSGLSVVYEALTSDPDKWGFFFVEEYKRLFLLAEQAENAFEILDCLEEISFVNEELTGFNEDIIAILTKYIDHPKDAIRYQAIWHLGDWITEENQSKHSQLISWIADKLHDKNWRIRYITELILKDMEQLPPGFSTKWTDKIRAKFRSPFSMK